MISPASLSATYFSLGFCGFFVRFPLRQIFVEAKASLGVMLRLIPESLGVFWSTPSEHLEARFHQHEILHFARRRPGIEKQRILALGGPSRVVAIEQPLSRIDCRFLIRHRSSHVDAVS